MLGTELRGYIGTGKKGWQVLKDKCKPLKCERLAIVEYIFPALDLAFFALQKNERPRFAYYEIAEDGEVSGCRWRNYMTGDEFTLEMRLPKPMADAIAKGFISGELSDVRCWTSGIDQNRPGFVYNIDFRLLRSQLRPPKGKALEFTSEFSGIIPDAIKEAIETTRPFFDQIGLIAEVDKWNEEIVQTDPLLVGFLKEKCFLIAFFDCSSAEEYIRREFTKDAKEDEQ